MKPRYLLSIFYLVSGFLALVIAPYYANAGMQAFEDTSSVSNSAYYLLMIIAFTAFIMLIARLKKELVKILFYFLLFITYFYAFLPFLSSLSILPSALLLIALIKKENWMVTNVSAILVSSAVIAIFGISMEPFPVVVLLVALAVYDFISVYKTKHMIKLAESISGLNIPVIFRIPGKNRDAIMGVGDVVMPNILVVSAFIFNRCLTQVLLTFFSGFAGLVLLLFIVEKSQKAHAGLPILNSFAILGYLIGFALCQYL